MTVRKAGNYAGGMVRIYKKEDILRDAFLFYKLRDLSEAEYHTDHGGEQNKDDGV